MRQFLFLLLFLSFSPLLSQEIAPKREFRGAWIQCVNGQFQGMSREQMQKELKGQLNALEKAGINAVIFQVRAEGDALYEGKEPWSRFLSGTQGKAPEPFWDPLSWMVEQCHARGMELHAWINPFRAKTKGTTHLAASHPYNLHPERFFSYDGLLIFNPALEENRRYICSVAADIVRRYDIDGLHIDDYFYPYPVPGEEIPDRATYEQQKNDIDDIASWRRYQVNLFIEMLSDSIHSAKPWVKFGVSPFGIYHNAHEGSNLPGSNTSGLQNYDDLYADVLFWANKGWVDYVIPQLYWEIGHPRADYAELIGWWSRFCGARPLFIGQDIERTVRASDLRNPSINQMNEKFRLQRSLRGIKGSCLWYSAALKRNEGNFATALEKNFHQRPSLQPLFPFLDNKAPGKPRKLKALWMPDGYYLFWTPPKGKGEMDQAKGYVVYRFSPGEEIDLSSSAHILSLTRQTFLSLPYEQGKEKFIYVVTALDRLQNESKPAKISLKL